MAADPTSIGDIDGYDGACAMNKRGAVTLGPVVLSVMLQSVLRMTHPAVMFLPKK